jgi:HEPN superfamily RiboL-PSP-like protein
VLVFVVLRIINQVNRCECCIISSIQSLVDARNDFAHGGNPTITFSDIKHYFGESKLLIETLDNVIG